ncbi:hypothetical protein OUZ56_005026 [Daphnia magna]|uniref:Uncharacterized protein n=1 Tax=Daphnia magna TaxID=35525 RepID=A0ABQ9YRT1_9CRUS|nr:hypothetical protein OUZ56_005026 [Daphnia magna]
MNLEISGRPSKQYSAGPVIEPPSYGTGSVIEPIFLCRVSAPPLAAMLYIGSMTQLIIIGVKVIHTKYNNNRRHSSGSNTGLYPHNTRQSVGCPTDVGVGC